MLDNPQLPVLPIVRPTFPPLEAISTRFGRALALGQVTNDGRYVREFEAALSEYLGVPTIALSSGMAALVAMLMVEGVAGHEVICPSFTFCATPHAIRLAGGKVVFADIDPDTLTLDPADVERKITPRTTAILGVDVYGICCDYNGLQRIADRHHCDLLFDSAPAFGSLVNGEPTGRYGRAQIFSFHATKPFSTMEGGCLCSNEEGFINKAKKMRNFGHPLWPKIFSRLNVGFNGKMMEVCALIGLEQLKTFSRIVVDRNFSVSEIEERISGIPGVSLIYPQGNQLPAWTYCPILIDEAAFGMSRDAVVEALGRRGIMVRTYYPAMHLDEAYRAEYVPLPVTERAASQVIALPIYSDMTGDECERIAGALREIQSAA